MGQQRDGVIQPIADIGRLCRSRGILFHTDSAQAIGKVELNLAVMPVDFASLTAHKLHGPMGVGVLYVREPRSVTPQLFGGTQEAGLRPGTENLPGIAGFGRATELRRARFADARQHASSLRDHFEDLVESPRLLVDKHAADWLGVGQNMAKSIQDN